MPGGGAGARAGPALQRAVDNAALSGAASYLADKATLNKVAVFTARSAFCNATTRLPNSFIINASSDNIPCGALQGANVSAGITAYLPGTPGIKNGICDSQQTVDPTSVYTCAFAVTVTATATTNMTFGGLLGASHTLSVTATAVNPFIDLNRAMSGTLHADAWNANSVWVYPLLLNDDGQPDFSSTTGNAGALPDSSTCTGDPTAQGWCGSYSMVATNVYLTCKPNTPCTSKCTTDNPCLLKDGTAIIEGGAVKRIHASSAVITATTPLGVALQSAAGGHQTPPGSDPFINYNAYGYEKQSNGKTLQIGQYKCTYPAKILYDTIAQAYDSKNRPLLVDSNGNWDLPTHWFYSSYLANNLPPSQRLLDIQNSQNNLQNVRAVPEILYDTSNKGSDNPITCTEDDTSSKTALNTTHELPDFPTKYPASDPTNCSLFVVMDPVGSNNPQPSSPNNGKCFSPNSTSATPTPGWKYATLSCQNYGRSSFAFFWNDMGGGAGTDDKDYGDANLVVKCSAAPKIILIN